MPQMYSLTFSAVAVSAAQDLFELNVASTKVVKVHSIFVGQYSDFGDAQAELVSIKLVRGHATSGSGGSAFTPLKLETGIAAAASTAEINNTTIASTGTGVDLIADAFNVAVGWQYRPTPEERIVLAPSERLVVRILAPTDAVTMNATMIFEELG